MKVHPAALTPEQTDVLLGSAAPARSWGAYLAGGSALALHLGHRRTVDLDWFTKNTVEPDVLLADLRGIGRPVEVAQNDEGTFLGRVGAVQYSVFRYRYDVVDVPLEYGGCTIASVRDIAAMKMTAIVQRATKRDYVDLHAILVTARVPLSAIVATMRQKYPGLQPTTAVRALTHFSDVEKQLMPEMLVKTTWEDVKRGLARVVERSRDGLGR